MRLTSSFFRFGFLFCYALLAFAVREWDSRKNEKDEKTVPEMVWLCREMIDPPPPEKLTPA